MAPRTRSARRIVGGVSLLLDEMFSKAIAEQLRARGHDVVAVGEDPSLVGSPDSGVLEVATSAGRAVVTANIKDFVRLDQQWRTMNRSHGGLVLVSNATFPQDRRFVGALVNALDVLLVGDGIRVGTVVFLQR